MNTRAKHFSTSRATILCREYVLVCSAHLAERLFFEQHFGMDALSFVQYCFVSRRTSGDSTVLRTGAPADITVSVGVFVVALVLLLLEVLLQLLKVMLLRSFLLLMLFP